MLFAGNFWTAGNPETIPWASGVPWQSCVLPFAVPGQKSGSGNPVLVRDNSSDFPQRGFATPKMICCYLRSYFGDHFLIADKMNANLCARHAHLLTTLRVNVKDDCVVVIVGAPLLLEVPPPPQPPSSNITDSTNSRIRQRRRTFLHREPIHRNPNGTAVSPNQVAR